MDKHPPAAPAGICPGERGDELRGRLAPSRGQRVPAEKPSGMCRRSQGKRAPGDARRGAAVPQLPQRPRPRRVGPGAITPGSGGSGGEEQAVARCKDGGWPVLPCPSRRARGSSPADDVPPGSSEVTRALRGLWNDLLFGCHGKGKSSLGQFAERFYLYEISLWLPEGREIAVPNGSAKATRGRWGRSAEPSLTHGLTPGSVAFAHSLPNSQGPWWDFCLI